MTIDLGRVTPIFRGEYDSAETYELNDIVFSGNELFWHVSDEPTTGIAPGDPVWALAFSGADVEEAIEEIKEDAEAIALGTRNGIPVSSSDPAYENNAKYYADQASGSASAASGSANAAAQWATGGTAGTPSATNNAKYYSEQASASASSAAADASDAEAYGAGTRGGTAVGSSDPAYHNNAKYYADEAEAAAATLTVDSAMSDSSTNPVQNKVIDGVFKARTLKNQTALLAEEGQTALTLPPNSYAVGSGSSFSGKLGTFPDALISSAQYRLEKIALSITDAGEVNATKLYRLFNMSGTEEWGASSTTGAVDLNWTNTKAIIQGTTNYTDGNYTSFPYAIGTTKTINAIQKTCCYTFQSSITADKIGGLPIYGKTMTVLTLRGQDNAQTGDSSSYNRLQLAWLNGGSTTAQRRMFFRASFSQSNSSWGEWYELHASIATVTAAFCGTSIMRGEIHTKVNGSDSTSISTRYKLPVMYGKTKFISVVDKAVGGQGLVSSWSTIYGEHGYKEEGYTFDGCDLLVCNWNTANDGTATGSLPLGTGADSEGTNTFLGYFNTFIKKMLTCYPGMSIVWIGPTGNWKDMEDNVPVQYSGRFAGGGTSFSLNDFCDGLKALCARYRIGFVDFRETNHINLLNCSTPDANTNGDILCYDKIHFTSLGYKKFSEIAIAGIGRYYQPGD